MHHAEIGSAAERRALGRVFHVRGYALAWANNVEALRHRPDPIHPGLDVVLLSWIGLMNLLQTLGDPRRSNVLDSFTEATATELVE